MQVKNLHLQSFVHVFYAKIAKQSSGAKPHQVPKNQTWPWRIFSANKKNKNSKNHKVTHVRDNTLLKIVGNEYCRAVHAQAVQAEATEYTDLCR